MKGKEVPRKDQRTPPKKDGRKDKYLDWHLKRFLIARLNGKKGTKPPLPPTQVKGLMLLWVADESGITLRPENLDLGLVPNQRATRGLFQELWVLGFCDILADSALHITAQGREALRSWIRWRYHLEPVTELVEERIFCEQFKNHIEQGFLRELRPILSDLVKL